MFIDEVNAVRQKTERERVKKPSRMKKVGRVLRHAREATPAWDYPGYRAALEVGELNS